MAWVQGGLNLLDDLRDKKNNALVQANEAFAKYEFKLEQLRECKLRMEELEGEIEWQRFKLQYVEGEFEHFKGAYETVKAKLKKEEKRFLMLGKHKTKIAFVAGIFGVCILAIGV
ncbi:conserved hypothetical protein [Ricinus communis]|uniref:Uncharacterized protein n=1 Tax=Ricinus communis TaxID=3988 RepID=B9SZ32_RICCO|nr:conserved hypothetical protein [Ricinus communis]